VWHRKALTAHHTAEFAAGDRLEASLGTSMKIEVFTVTPECAFTAGLIGRAGPSEIGHAYVGVGCPVVDPVESQTLVDVQKHRHTPVNVANVTDNLSRVKTSVLP